MKTDGPNGRDVPQKCLILRQRGAIDVFLQRRFGSGAAAGARLPLTASPHPLKRSVRPFDELASAARLTCAVKSALSYFLQRLRGGFVGLLLRCGEREEKKIVWEKKNQARLRADTNTNVKPVRVFCRRSTRYLLTLLTYRFAFVQVGT